MSRRTEGRPSGFWSRLFGGEGGDAASSEQTALEARVAALREAGAAVPVAFIQKEAEDLAAVITKLGEYVEDYEDDQGAVELILTILDQATATLRELGAFLGGGFDRTQEQRLVDKAHMTLEKLKESFSDQLARMADARFSEIKQNLEILETSAVQSPKGRGRFYSRELHRGEKVEVGALFDADAPTLRLHLGWKVNLLDQKHPFRLLPAVVVVPGADAKRAPRFERLERGEDMAGCVFDLAGAPVGHQRYVVVLGIEDASARKQSFDQVEEVSYRFLDEAGKERAWFAKPAPGAGRILLLAASIYRYRSAWRLTVLHEAVSEGIDGLRKLYPSATVPRELLEGTK